MISVYSIFTCGEADRSSRDKLFFFLSFLIICPKKSFKTPQAFDVSSVAVKT